MRIPSRSCTQLDDWVNTSYLQKRTNFLIFTDAFRLWDAIDNYLRSCKQEIARKAMHWSNSCRKKVAKRLEVKTAFLKTRYERVKIDIYDRRLAELRAHAERLERHKAVSNYLLFSYIIIQINFKGALKELDILTEQSNNYNEKYQQIIEEYEEKTEQILDRIRQVKVSNMARKYFCELSQTLKERDRAIAELEKAFEDTLSEKMDMISNATLAFNKSIKCVQNLHINNASQNPPIKILQVIFRRRQLQF